MYVPQPCVPSPCGANALCKERNGAGSCSCLAGYLGNPYEGCRPECVISTDCVPSKSCVRFKCEDPCPGTCGQNAVCQVINHMATCSCLPRYTGDPFRYCREEDIGTCCLPFPGWNSPRFYPNVSLDRDPANFDQPLPAVTLRTEQPLQREQRASSLLLLARVSRFSTRMQTRVRGERRMRL